jgi:hypothetical protein
VTITRRLVRWFAHRPYLLPVLGVAAALSVTHLPNERFVATPIFLPVYDIEAQSGTCTASLLNLGMGQPGVLQVPMPVDVDCDLLPDVLVSVNLIDVDGLVQNPPDLNDVLAPNIRFTRIHAPTTTLGRPSPPVKLQVKFTIRDLEGTEPDTVVRFGYDTGLGGSIPQDFKAIVRGIENFFNPITAELSTVGYQGPLTIVGSFQSGDEKADLAFGYRPFPVGVVVTYGSGDCGAGCSAQHVEYTHATRDEVDLDVKLTFMNGDDLTDVTGRIDRMPRHITLDLKNSQGGGSADYATPGVDGRQPDAAFSIKSLKAGEQPLLADVDIEGLPAAMHGDWSFPDSGPKTAHFTASGQGIGAIEADVRDYAGTPVVLAPSFVPQQQQYMSFETATGGPFDSESRIRARIERIREVSFTQADDGFASTVKIGDGELPLQAHFRSDSRNQPDGLFVEAKSTISPLPDSVTIEFSDPDVEPTEVDPMRIAYTASQSIDVDADLVLREAEAPLDCAKHGNLCASFKARHIPPSIEARVINLPERLVGTETKPAEMRIEVDTDNPFSDVRPDFFADAIIGQAEDCDPPAEGCVTDGLPIVAHAELLHFPKNIRIRAVEGEGETLERLEFHACKRLFDLPVPACEAGTEDKIGALSFSARNFVDRATTNVPPAVPATPLYATIVARGLPTPSKDVLFEATGKVTDISEIQYLNKGVFGIRTVIGAGKNFSAHVDVKDVDVKSDEIGRVDVLADARITPLPADFDLCFRRSGLDLVPAPSSPFTAPCEVSQPFEGLTLDKSPVSFAYRSSHSFDVETKAVVRFQKSLPAVPPDVPEDDQFIRGYLKLENVPKSLTTHVLVPEGDELAPIRVLHDAPAVTQCNTPGCSGQVNVIFAAELTDGDLQCEDPRLAPHKRQALCLSGRVENLPTKVDLRYDPRIHDGTNLTMNTVATKKLNLADLRLSLVRRAVDENGDPLPKPNVLVAEADILGLPRNIEGTIDLPGTVAVSAVPATDPTAKIDSIDATVRNFIVPDPMPSTEPAREIKTGVIISPGDPAIQKVLFFGRQDEELDLLLFKAIAHISDVVGFSYKTLKDTDGKLADTKVVTVDFSQDKTIRAYADIDDGVRQIIGDVILPDVPAGMTLCFRGEKKGGSPPESAKTFCDRAPKNDKIGAFQFVQRPINPAANLDVHAYVRLATGAGTEVLSGRVDIENIPKVVQGTFGDGTADAGGFEALNASGVGITPDGIDQIKFHLATFDIADHGYIGLPPFNYRPLTGDPFPAVSSATNEHVGLAANDEDFELVGRIGVVETANPPPVEPGSDLQRILVDNVPCAKPAPPDEEALPRPDYPFFPLTDGVSKYTCVRGVFEEVGPDVDDPLLLNAKIDKGGERIALHHAGLTEIPSWFQATISDSPALQLGSDDAKRAFRPACKAADHPDPVMEQDPAVDCAPPFLRLDTPGLSKIFGVIQKGKKADLDALDGVPVREGPFPDPDQLPDTNAFEDGIRVKVGQFKEGTESRTALKGSLRLGIPPSLTVDPVQSWSDKSAVAGAFYEASDTRFRYIIRDKNGVRINKIGELSAMVHSFVDGTQILVSNDNPADGIPIPGEVALGIYNRNDKEKGRNFFQIDGRISTENTSPRIRVMSGDTHVIPNVDGRILHIPHADNSYATYYPDGITLKPSFRLRAQISSEGESAPSAAEGSSAGGEPSGELASPSSTECSILYCLEVDVRLNRVTAKFDFAPAGGTPARLVEAVVNTMGIKNGVQLKSWSDVDGAEHTPRPITLNADVLVSPINVFLHAGIPIIGSLDFILVSDLKAGLHLQQVTDFQLRQNIIHLRTGVTGGPNPPGAPSFDLHNEDVCFGFSCLYVDYRIYQLHGIAFSILGLLWGNPILLGIDFLPPSLPRLPPPLFSDPITGLALAIPFAPCGPVSPGGLDILPLIPGIEQNVVLVPLADPRIIFYGTLAPLFEGIRLLTNLFAPVFCFFPVGDSDIPLIGGASFPGEPGRRPGDPLFTVFPGHVVPGITGATTSSLPASSSATTPQQLDLGTVGNVALCGDRLFDSVAIPAGKTLTVAAGLDTTDLIVNGVNLGDKCPEDPDVPGANFGRLSLVAVKDASITGTVLGASKELSIVGETINLNAGGLVKGSTGKVTLAAAKTLNVVGNVEANGVVTFTTTGAGSGNSGAGHGDPGGVGQGFVPGAPGGEYGNEDFFPPVNEAQIRTETGARGGRGNALLTPGGGGGALSLISGRTITISGTVSAKGTQSPASGTGGNCAQPDTDPDPAIDNSTPNDGDQGPGGGSGGGIVIAAPNVTGAGAVNVSGGNGADGKGGGGGGGAGGRVKIRSPLYFGPAPAIAGGSSGALLCPGDFGAAPASGGIGEVLTDDSPTSNTIAFPTFWHHGAFPGGEPALQVPYTAAAKDLAGNHGFQVVLCGFFVSVDRPNQDQTPNDGAEDGLQQSFPSMSDLQKSALSPCGKRPFASPYPDPVFLGSANLPNTTLTADGATITASNLPVPPSAQANGYWGVYTTVLKSNDGTNCVSGNVIDILFHCLSSNIEAPPGAPETNFGYDNNAPGSFEQPQPFVVGTTLSVMNDMGIPVSTSKDIRLTVTTPKDQMSCALANCGDLADPDGKLPLSGLSGFKCQNVPFGFVDCAAGEFPWTLPTGDGKKTVTVRALDLAGNKTDVSIDVILDTQVPTATGVADSPPDLHNNWYSVSPTFTFSNFSDPGGADSSGFGVYEFRFDEGGVRTCDTSVCHLKAPGDCGVDPTCHETELPGPGRHTLFWRPVDKLGLKPNDFARIDVKIDNQDPLSALTTVPVSPNGANKWYVGTTWVAISVFDLPPGGSGLKLAPDELPGDGNEFGVFFKLNGGLEQQYTEPFDLDPGSWTICWRVVDVAGNSDGSHCTPEPIKVDQALPNVAIVPAPAAPNGDNGWYTSKPTIRILTTDAVPGSSVNPGYDPDLSDLCTGRPLVPDPNEKAPSGTCVAIDAGPYLPYDGAVITIPEGLHRVRAFAIDVSGQQSIVRELLLKVDLSHPVTTLRMRPPDPARLGWWRTLPKAVLRAVDGDQNAGVKETFFSLNGATFAPYREPFMVPEGVNTLKFYSTDLSGAANDEPVRTVTIKVDVTPVVASAKSPDPAIWARALGPPKVKLRWELKDNLSGTINVVAIVYDVTGRVVTRIDDGTRVAVPNTTLAGFTEWDGTDEIDIGLPVKVPILAGLYFYRMIFIDEAGNYAQSGESSPLLIKAS